MTRELWRRTDEVVVPDVVGMALSEARQIAGEAGLALAQPDPDGPPLGALTWPGEYVVTSQDPPPGARLWRWDAVVVTWSALDRGDPAGVREPRRPKPSLTPMGVEYPLSPE
jgi:beta-lactam-binding protein with PASTA domain